MKNLGSRWTVPDIARTAAARSSFLVAISLERDSGSIINKSSLNRNRNKARSSSNGSNSSNSSIRLTAIDEKRESKRNGGSAIDVLHGAHLSVRAYVTAPCDRIIGTTHSESTTPIRNRPQVAGKSSQQPQHRTRRPRQPSQQQLYYPPASWDTRTLHFRNC
ncbi:hypothetical protein ACFW04_006774 [Cataglyphis niger]